MHDTLPLLFWCSYMSLTVAGLPVPAPEAPPRGTAWGLWIAIAAVDITSIMSGSIAWFIGVELGLWSLQIIVATILALVSPPPGARSEADVTSIIVSSTQRMLIAAMTACIAVG